MPDMVGVKSVVIGKPVAMMLMKRHATITVCHSRTAIDDFRDAGHNADVVVSALGRAKMIGSEILGSGQTVIDVGINVDEEGNLYSLDDLVQKEDIVDELVTAVYDSSSQ